MHTNIHTYNVIYISIKLKYFIYFFSKNLCAADSVCFLLEKSVYKYNAFFFKRSSQFFFKFFDNSTNAENCGHHLYLIICRTDWSNKRHILQVFIQCSIFSNIITVHGRDTMKVSYQVSARDLLVK